MAKKRKAEAEIEAPKEVEVVQKNEEVEPKVKLRLIQTDFVHGKQWPEGKVFEFTPEQAAKRLREEQLWERI